MTGTCESVNIVHTLGAILTGVAATFINFWKKKITSIFEFNTENNKFDNFVVQQLRCALVKRVVMNTFGHIALSALYSRPREKF